MHGLNIQQQYKETSSISRYDIVRLITAMKHSLHYNYKLNNYWFHKDMLATLIVIAICLTNRVTSI